MKQFSKIFFITFFSILYADESKELPWASADAIQKLYQTMKDVHELFTKHQIAYWIDAGTLLGALRHWGLIPWDDDLDVSMDKKDELRFLALDSELESLGYKIIGMPFGYKVYPIDGLDIEHVPWKYPFIDFFMMEDIGEKYVYVTSWGRRKRDGEPVYMKKTEIFPRKEYFFGPIIVWGPNNPFPVLDAWYGSDWETVAYRSYDHKNEVRVESRKVILTKEERKPALPKSPLINKIKKIEIKKWPQDFQESFLKKVTDW